MIKVSFKWGELQPKWVTNASQYARTELGLYGDDELGWIRLTLGYYVETTPEEITIIFEDDKDYTMAVLRWGG